MTNETQHIKLADWTNFEETEIGRHVYVDPELYEMEKEKIFKKSWVFVGFEEEIPAPGKYRTTYIGEIPVVVVRNKESKLKVFENTCTHRGALVARENDGECSFFRCLYHQWTFDLDGKLKGVPSKYREWLGEDLNCYNLPEVPRVETFQGLIFASYNQHVEPIEQYLANAVPELNDIFRNQSFEIIGSHKWIIEANWKTYMENVCDGYHGVLLHRILGALAYNTEGTGTALGNGHGMQKWKTISSLEKVTHEQGEKVKLHDYSVLETSREGDNRVMTIFPNLLILHQADMLNIRQVLPLGVDRLQVIALSVVPKGSSNEFKERSAMQYANYFGPAGIAGFDDNIALRNVQMGVAAPGVAKSVISLGGTETHGGKQTEAQIRGIYKMWKKLMNASS